MEYDRINIGPWYKNYDFYKSEAEKYLDAYNNLPKNEMINSEIENFNENSIFRLIFESNTIENAGTKTLGETKRILIGNKSSDEVLEELKIINKTINSKIKPILSYIRKSKGQDEVIQHLTSIQSSKFYLNNFLSFQNNLKIKIIKKTPYLDPDGKYKGIIYEYEPLVFTENDTIPKLFSIEMIKDLHLLIGDDLMPLDSDLTAGEFRNYNNISVGHNPILIFPSAKSIGPAMKKFCEDSNYMIMNKLEGKETDIFQTAAKILIIL